MVVARTDEAHAALQAQVRRREVERVYLALAEGRLGLAHRHDRRADRPRRRGSAHRMAVSGAASREARTHFTVLELLAAETYLEARLETGRTHQIRAHFAAIGHPLAGDPDLRRRRAATGSSASSCTPTGSPSRTRRAASGSSSSSELPRGPRRRRSRPARAA